MQTAVDPLFQNYASLGNSITAGYQGGGINQNTQAQSYAVLFAQQAGTRFAIPDLQYPGCAPPIDSFPSHRVTPPGFPPSTAASCYLRTQGSVTPAVNNVAVPGAASIDPVTLTTGNSNALTMFILGGSTQVARASQLQPTFVSMWIGNNDVLAAALSGILVPVPGVSPGVTPLPTFVTNYKNDVNGLRANASLKGGVLFAVVDVTNAPLLFHSNLLFTPYLAAFEAAAGTVVTVDPSCANAVPLIDFQLAGAIKAGTHRPNVTCKSTPTVGPYPLDGLYGQIYVLDSVEVPAVIADVAAYNAYIKAKADSIGWAYVDVNPSLQALKTAGLIPIFPDLLSPTNTFGNYFTLDGVHPSGLAHQLIVGLMIDSVNAKYGTSVPGLP
jgi:lysophospholipase L1-like esterase